MKHSGITLYLIIISTFCFFTTYTVLCLSSPFWASPTTTNNNLHGSLSRRALSTHLNRHEKESIKVLDTTRRLPNQEAYHMEAPVNDGSHEAEGELIYHIDYHGVTTHPGPNPKHGRP